MFDAECQGGRDSSGDKNVFEPRKGLPKIFVPQHDLLRSFGTPTTKLKIAQNIFAAVLQFLKEFYM